MIRSLAEVYHAAAVCFAQTRPPGGPTFYPRENDRVRHGELDDQVQTFVFQQSVEELGLGGFAWEAVEDEVVASELEQARRDQLEDSRVGEEACEEKRRRHRQRVVAWWSASCHG